MRTWGVRAAFAVLPLISGCVTVPQATNEPLGTNPDPVSAPNQGNTPATPTLGSLRHFSPSSMGHAAALLKARWVAMTW
jgi:hypothetical protein